MSWSFNCIGKPAAVARAIDSHSDTLSGQSRVEFDDAKPHLMALVSQNFSAEGSGYAEALIEFEASGSGAARSDAQIYRSCTVHIRPIWKNFVT